MELDESKSEEIKVINTIDKSNWLQVFSANLGKMMAIQSRVDEYVIKNRNWSVDFTKGTISFGDDVYPMQLIGSESKTSNTWNWGWNNVNHFSDSLIVLANQTLSVGESWKLDPLTIPQFELDDVFNGHNLSIVVCGLSDDKYFYYRGPHSGGAVFMAIENPSKEIFAPIGIQEFIGLIIQCIQRDDVDHKIFVEALLEWNKTQFEWNGNVLTAHFDQDLSITFEQDGLDYYISAVTQINNKIC